MGQYAVYLLMFNANETLLYVYVLLILFYEKYYIDVYYRIHTAIAVSELVLIYIVVKCNSKQDIGNILW
jgi:hypothetical protein